MMGMNIGNGMVTRREARILKRDLAALARTASTAMKDGKVTKSEAKRLAKVVQRLQADAFVVSHNSERHPKVKPASLTAAESKLLQHDSVVLDNQVAKAVKDGRVSRQELRQVELAEAKLQRDTFEASRPIGPGRCMPKPKLDRF